MYLSVESTRFTDTESEELVRYHSVNRWAVAAAVLGGLSWVAVMHPLMLFIPLVGLAVGLFAARQLAAPDSMQSGKHAAQWGVFLCLMFGLWAGTWLIYRQNLIANQARQCAERWLEMIHNGQLHEAHQLTLDEDKRVAPNTMLDQHYAYRERRLPSLDPSAGGTADNQEEMMSAMEPSPYELFNQFFGASPAKRLSELRGRAKYEYLRTVQQTQLGSINLSVKQLFGVSYEEGGEIQRFVISIELDRTLIERVASWRVLRVSDESNG